MNHVRTDTTLMNRCIAGDDRAWKELHQDFYPQARSFLRRLGVPPREAEDVCQDVFLQVFRYIGRFEHRADFRTWLYKICVSQAHRFRRSRTPLLLRWLPRSAAEEERNQALAPSWPEMNMAEQARRALDRMKPLHRPAFVLYELEGFSAAEIALILDCPVATVWRRVHYARREFESWVNEGPLEGHS
jgi:RNA polymerase sigma-70 factor, ECF subfamily